MRRALREALHTQKRRVLWPAVALAHHVSRYVTRFSGATAAGRRVSIFRPWLFAPASQRREWTAPDAEQVVAAHSNRTANFGGYTSD